jgi:uncharacterized membrane protein YccC
MRALPQRLRDPVLWAGVSQLLKTVAAAVIAWVVAVDVLGLDQAFLAPWAALLTVHATVYRTLTRGLQQAGATLLGVLLAFAAGNALGVNAGSLAVMLVAAMAAGATPMLRAESTTAAATALIVLVTGLSGDVGVLLERLLDSGVGIAVGLLVNLLVWPPLRDRAAARRVDVVDDRLGELLTDIARRLREDGGQDEADAWVRRTRALDRDIEQAWGDVEQARESGRLNLRQHAADRIRASDDFEALLTRLEQAVAETRSMARTLRRAGPSARSWSPAFRGAWLELLGRAAAAISAADGLAVRRLQREVEHAGRTLVTRPAQGALLVNLRNILEAMDAVAEAQPVRERVAKRRAGTNARAAASSPVDRAT